MRYNALIRDKNQPIILCRKTSEFEQILTFGRIGRVLIAAKIHGGDIITLKVGRRTQCSKDNIEGRITITKIN